MVKAIFANQAQRGDGLLLSDGKAVDVLATGRHGGDIVDLLVRDRATKKEDSILLNEYAIVGLVYHSWAATEAQMQDAILKATQAFVLAAGREKEARLWTLYHAIEAYELGKPETKA